MAFTHRLSCTGFHAHSPCNDESLSYVYLHGTPLVIVRLAHTCSATNATLGQSIYSSRLNAISPLLHALHKTLPLSMRVAGGFWWQLTYTFMVSLVVGLYHHKVKVRCLNRTHFIWVSGTGMPACFLHPCATPSTSALKFITQLPLALSAVRLPCHQSPSLPFSSNLNAFLVETLIPSQSPIDPLDFAPISCYNSAPGSA